MNYKALICDVDGTLIQNKKDGMPSERVIKSIQKASKVLHVGVATSRVYSDLHHLFKVLNLSGPSIIHSGGQIRDASSGKAYFRHTISQQDFKKIFHLTKPYHNKMIVDDEDSYFSLHDSLQLDEMIITGAIVKGITAEEADKLIANFSHLSNISVQKIVSWEHGKVDVNFTPKEATKQHGIMELAKVLGIKTHEIIGVGDGHNDFPLLMACGLKIAMGNAIDDLKAIADYVAPTVNEDGVAHIIEKFILK